jgi:tartrate dehydrogenase/decarboxylase/D-malate dehydrogenase
MTPTFRIALIAGDGIGKEVMPEGLRVVLAAAERFGFELDCRTIAWASCDYHAEHGQMMPDDWKEQLQGVDAIYFGAVGWPATVPDHVSLWGSLLKFRREFDQYINLRPVRLFEGVPCPLAGRKPGDIDYLVVRENTEGEYTSLGGTMYEGTERARCARATAPTACSGTPVNSPSRASASTSRWPPRATGSRSACRGGTAAPMPSAATIPR